MEEICHDFQDSVRQQKASIRKQVACRRKQLTHKAELSRQIWDHLRRFPPFTGASTVCSYVALPDEVQTAEGLQTLLAEGKRVVVPFCSGEELKLRLIVSLDELCPGHWGILEPLPAVREDPQRNISFEEIDVILVPGVAFDCQGRRLGRGKGFYDRLLARLPARCLRIGLAFRCQLFDRLPELPHDARVDAIATESGIILCRSAGCQRA